MRMKMVRAVSRRHIPREGSVSRGYSSCAQLNERHGRCCRNILICLATLTIRMRRFPIYFLLLMSLSAHAQVKQGQALLDSLLHQVPHTGADTMAVMLF